MPHEGVFTPASVVTLSHMPLATQCSNVKLHVVRAHRSDRTVPWLVATMSGSARVATYVALDLVPTGPSWALLTVLYVY